MCKWTLTYKSISYIYRKTKLSICLLTKGRMPSFNIYLFYPWNVKIKVNILMCSEFSFCLSKKTDYPKIGRIKKSFNIAFLWPKLNVAILALTSLTHDVVVFVCISVYGIWNIAPSFGQYPTKCPQNILCNFVEYIKAETERERERERETDRQTDRQTDR
jgi:hypothetical protein